MKTTDLIRRQLRDNPVILYMEGTPTAPRCGFSAKAAGVMKSTGIAFAYVDVLAHPRIMEALPEVSDFPTFPQLFVHGEIIDVIARGVFTSVTDLKRKLMRYMHQYNKNAKPVKWKYFDPPRRITPGSIVTAHQRAFRFISS